jgi:hypothetical protein
MKEFISLDKDYQASKIELSKALDKAQDSQKHGVNSESMASISSIG